MVIQIKESEICNLVKESVSRLLKTQFLYHKAPKSARKSILKNGLIPSVGNSYKSHWDDRKDLTPYIFLYNYEVFGEYDTTYDDDIYAIDIKQLDKKHLGEDPDKYMKGCLVYDLPIPPTAIKLIYKGSNRDSDDLTKHADIYNI